MELTPKTFTSKLARDVPELQEYDQALRGKTCHNEPPSRNTVAEQRCDRYMTHCLSPSVIRRAYLW